MTKRILILMLFVLPLTAWVDVEINETNFPDEMFRLWLSRQSYGSDGVLTDEEIAQVSFIRIVNYDVQSLQGIEYFTALTGRDCSANQLTALDVSNNRKLRYLYCHQNQIKGAAMDYLVESLPAITNVVMNTGARKAAADERSRLNVIFGTNDQNGITTLQVTAAKSKGWTSYYTDGKTDEQGEYIWHEYAGSDPTAIDHVRKEQDDAPWYDLNGRQCQTTPTRKGIYIHEGRKIIVNNSQNYSQA